MSRVFAELTKQNLAQQLFRNLVTQCQEEGIIDGQHVAMDSAAIDAYEKKQSKSRSAYTGHANWEAEFDSFGNKWTWFGYKMDLAVDTHNKLPIAAEVTPAHINDGDVAPDLMADAIEILDTKPKFFIMNAGYNQYKNDEYAHQHGAQAIIPLNLRHEKEPPAGMMSNGTPQCTMEYEMTYWGADQSYLKFRCPHATDKVDFPLGMAACSPSNYGMVTNVRLDDDLRRYRKPHRDTRQWKELYSERTSVERCKSCTKTYLTANSRHVWGISKVQTHVYLNAIVLLVSALAMSKQKQGDQVA